MKRKLQLVAVSVASVALVLASTPAFATPRSLPAGQSLYVFGCEDGTIDPAVGLVDVATGAVTAVVPPSGNSGQCYSGPSYNPVDGKIYVIDWTNNYDLAVFDPQAKTLTVIAPFDCSPYAMAIDASGNAWVWDSDTYNLRPLNLQTAACGTGVGQVSGSDYFYGMAFGQDGSLYGVDYATGEFGTISTTNGAFTQVASSAMGTGDNAGFTFDSSGIAWVIDEVNNAEVYSANVSDYSGTAQLSGQLTSNGTDFYSEAIVAGPSYSPKLPDTGTPSVALGVAGIAAAGLIALGAVVLFVRRRAS